MLPASCHHAIFDQQVSTTRWWRCPTSLRRPRSDWPSCFARIQGLSVFVAHEGLSGFPLWLRLKAKKLALETGAPLAENVKRCKTSSGVPAGQGCKGRACSCVVSAGIYNTFWFCSNNHNHNRVCVACFSLCICIHRSLSISQLFLFLSLSLSLTLSLSLSLRLFSLSLSVSLCSS